MVHCEHITINTSNTCVPRNTRVLYLILINKPGLHCVLLTTTTTTTIFIVSGTQPQRSLFFAFSGSLGHVTQSRDLCAGLIGKHLGSGFYFYFCLVFLVENNVIIVQVVN